MALKLRLIDSNIPDYESSDPQVNVMIEAFDDLTGYTIRPGNLVYSGAVLAGMTSQQIATRIRTDALAWAAKEKAKFADSDAYQDNIALMQKLAALEGAEVEVP